MIRGCSLGVVQGTVKRRSKEGSIDGCRDECRKRQETLRTPEAHLWKDPSILNIRNVLGKDDDWQGYETHGKHRPARTFTYPL